MYTNITGKSLSKKYVSENKIIVSLIPEYKIIDSLMFFINSYDSTNVFDHKVSD
jgi:hypothetical protein